MPAHEEHDVKRSPLNTSPGIDVSCEGYSRDVSLVAPEPELPPWMFLTNHAHVLIAISRNPELRQRDIAYSVGITVGAVQRIIHELEDEAYLESERVGRRNRYKVNGSKKLRHPLENQHTVADLIESLDQ